LKCKPERKGWERERCLCPQKGVGGRVEDEDSQETRTTRRAKRVWGAARWYVPKRAPMTKVSVAAGIPRPTDLTKPAGRGDVRIGKS